MALEGNEVTFTDEELLAGAIETFMASIPLNKDGTERDWSSVEMARFIIQQLGRLA